MNDNKDLSQTDGIEKSAKKKTGTGSKRGMYTAAISALVIAIVIIFNLVIGGLPSGTLEYDITGRDVYVVTEQSVKYLSTLEKDVSIVVLAQSAAVDERVMKLINNYAKLSAHITLKIVDPVLDPTALTTYNAQENTVVVRCAETDKTEILSLAGIEGYADGLILYDAQAYQYGQLQPVALDAEGQLTSAINKVTSDTTNKIYLLSGHGESDLATTASSYITKANYETAPLNLLKDGKIPDDCQLIICNNPIENLANDERTLLQTYLRNGGKVLLLLDNPTLSNFNALLAVYGLEMQNGYVGEGDRYYPQYGNFFIYPVLSTTSDITAAITTDAFLRKPRGMLEITPERRGSAVTPFMTTSAEGILSVDENTALSGQFILGATVTETFADKAGVETRLTVITAIDLINEEVATNIGLTNLKIFMNAVNMNFSEAQGLIIPEKSLNLTPISIDPSHSGIWSILFIGIIPIAFLASGFVYWARRRNR